MSGAWAVVPDQELENLIVESLRNLGSRNIVAQLG